MASLAPQASWVGWYSPPPPSHQWLHWFHWAGGNAQYKQVALGETEPTSRGLLGPDKGDEWAAVADLDLFFQRV